MRSAIGFRVYLLQGPIYAYFEGGGEGRQKKNAIFFVKIFQKVPENGFFDLFFQKFACGVEIFPKTVSFYCFRRARKINLVDLKKRSKFSFS